MQDIFEDYDEDDYTCEECGRPFMTDGTCAECDSYLPEEPDLD